MASARLLRVPAKTRDLAAHLTNAIGHFLKSFGVNAVGKCRAYGPALWDYAATASVLRLR